MFEFIVVVILANAFMLAALYFLRHVISIRAPVLLMAVGISIIYCVLYPYLAAIVSYPQVIYLYLFLIMAGAGTLYFIESRFFAIRPFQEDKVAAIFAGEVPTAILGGAVAREEIILSSQEEASLVEEGAAAADLSTYDMDGGTESMGEFSALMPDEEAVFTTTGPITGTREDKEEEIPFYDADGVAAGVEMPEDAVGGGSGDIYIEEYLAVEELIAGDIYIDELPPAEAVAAEAYDQDESLIFIEEKDAEVLVPGDVHAGIEAAEAGVGALNAVIAGDPEDQIAGDDDINRLVAGAFDRLASGDSAGAVGSFFKALKLDPPPKLALLLCTRISSIYMAQGLKRQALGVLEMLEVVWGPLLEEGDLDGIKTIIIQLRGEK